MELYEVVAKNCDTAPRIEYSRKNLTKATAIFAASNLVRGFRQVDILNQETGEVMFARYESDDFFHGEMSPIETIALVESCF